MLVNTLYLLDVYTESKIKQATRDQHSDVILGLTFFLTSRSKQDYICCFKPPNIRQY